MAEMRRKDRQLPEAEARAVLAAGEYGILATADGQGNPYAVPVSYTVDGDKIYFHGAGVGEKTENMLRRPAVCFTVVGATEVLPAKFSTRYESVVVFGTAERLEDREAKAHGLRLMVKKYSPAHVDAGERYMAASMDETAVWVIRIERITGKARR